jgi:hypothetical protein
VVGEGTGLASVAAAGPESGVAHSEGKT